MPVLEREPVISTAPRLKWLPAFLICNALIMNAGLAAATRLFVFWNLIPPVAAPTTLGAVRDFLTFRQGTDSWMPMLEAARLYETGRPIYDTLFFERNVKFQYPLTSLLPVLALKRAGFSDGQLLLLARISSWIAVWGIIGAAIALWKSTRGRASAIFAIVLAGLCFYPIVKGYTLGQIQTFLTLLFAVAAYLWLQGRETAAAVPIGLMILVKPQYAAIVIWFALRKRYGALAAALATAAAGFVSALAVFGWHEQMRYLDVIRYAGSRGHAYYPNLSFNGLANRLLFTEPSLVFNASSYAPYHPWVTAVTLTTSALLLGAALYPRAWDRRGGMADFCGIAIAATAASPIAWEHHYGILFPIFLVMASMAANRTEIAILAVAYALVADAWSPLNALAGSLCSTHCSRLRLRVCSPYSSCRSAWPIDRGLSGAVKSNICRSDEVNSAFASAAIPAARDRWPGSRPRAGRNARRSAR